MGFYVRKRLSAGPIRFNLSKSGIGVSAGVPGFRIGTGPRGNYVHAGRHGLYYRASLGGGKRRGGAAGQRPAPMWTPPPGTGVPMEDVTGASVLDLQPSGRGDLVDQLNEAAKRVHFGRWAAIAALVLLFVKPPVGLIIALVASPAVVWLILRDRARRAVVVFYDVNDEAAEWFQRLVDAVDEASKMSRAWRINTSGSVRTTYQYKVNSGANTIVSRARLAVGFAGPKQLKTNIAVPSVRAGKDALHFLPDRLFVGNGKRFSDVAYGDLHAAASSGRFIESEGRPNDARQVDTTWQYVNVGGGPDRRYNNNRQLPVMLYGNLELTSDGGLIWLLQASRENGFLDLASVLRQAPRALDHQQNGADLATDKASEQRDLPPTETGFQKVTRVGPDGGGTGGDGARPAQESSEDRFPPRVPRTEAERKELLEAKSPAWESLLFASYLLDGKKRLEPKWRDHELQIAIGRRRKVNLDEASSSFEQAMSDAQDEVAKMMSLLSPHALEPAFGASGEPGNPALIEHAASRFIESYDRLLEWPEQIRRLEVPAALKPAFETASHLIDRPLETIRSFIDSTVNDLDQLAERMKNEESIQLRFELTLEMDENLVRRFHEQMAQAHQPI